jgi:hypothetical protein
MDQDEQDEEKGRVATETDARKELNKTPELIHEANRLATEELRNKQIRLLAENIMAEGTKKAAHVRSGSFDGEPRLSKVDIVELLQHNDFGHGTNLYLGWLVHTSSHVQTNSHTPHTNIHHASHRSMGRRGSFVNEEGVIVNASSAGALWHGGTATVAELEQSLHEFYRSMKEPLHAISDHMEAIHLVCSKINQRAVGQYGSDDSALFKVFQELDQDRSGDLQYEELRKGVRTSLGLSRREVSDEAIQVS